MNAFTPLAGARLAVRPHAVAIAAALLCATAAQAVEINTGNEDLAVRWDNTVRYNYAVRAEGRDQQLANSALADEGDYAFNKGDAVAKRLDLLSELDIIYKRNYGMRVSAAGWYDGAYGDKSKSNPNPPLNGIPSYVGNNYSDYTKRFYAGPSGEILDAFVFGNGEIGNVPVSGKAGRHTLYWGESLFLTGHLHSVSYSQNPLDLQKGFATPGVEAKELFRPLNQLSGSAQLTDTLSVAGQYLLEWEAARYPEGGTYLGPVDFVFNGPDRQFVSPALGFAYRGSPAEPKQNGEWGLSAHWNPAWLDGSMGFYVRRFADKLPQTLLTQVAPNSGSVYNLEYADNINLYGVSLAKNIGGVSVGSEFSYRQNTPLNSQVLGIAVGLPNQGDVKGARGDTMHALVNAVGALPKTAFFDQATYAAEVAWSHWVVVRSGANLFNAIGYAPCNGKDSQDGCVTPDYVGAAFSFTPTWYQVFPGVDLSAPLSYSLGLSGNAATVFGGNEGLGNYAVGIGADVYQKYRFDLKYIDFMGRDKSNGTAVTSVNGLNTYLKDRGFVSLTFKTTF